MGRQDQVKSRRHAVQRKAKSRGMVSDTSGNDGFGFCAGPSGFAQAGKGSGEHRVSSDRVSPNPTSAPPRARRGT